MYIAKRDNKQVLLDAFLTNTTSGPDSADFHGTNPPSCSSLLMQTRARPSRSPLPAGAGDGGARGYSPPARGFEVGPAGMFDMAFSVSTRLSQSSARSDTAAVNSSVNPMHPAPEDADQPAVSGGDGHAGSVERSGSGQLASPQVRATDLVDFDMHRTQSDCSLAH